MGKGIITTTAVAIGATALAITAYRRALIYTRHHLGPLSTITANAASLPRIARAKTRDVPTSPSHRVYPPDLYPGGRNVRTSHGTIKVFEWGPENGEKVLLLQGVGTPSVGYGDLLHELVRQGYRVMTYDYFGRGHSDSPTDLPHDTRLYLTQLLLVLASSPLSWTGTSAFHLIGYSLGGGLAVSFASQHLNLLRSLTLVCPGGLVRSSSQLTWQDRMLYSTGLVPNWAQERVMRRRLDPGRGGGGEDVPVEVEAVRSSEAEAVNADHGGELGKAGGKEVPSWDDLMRWQLDTNEGFVRSYLSSFQHAPLFDQHEGDWKTLGTLLSERKSRDGGHDTFLGLTTGRMCVVLGKSDPYIDYQEWIDDADKVLGKDSIDLHLHESGHEIAITHGVEVARIAVDHWRKGDQS